MNDDDIEVFIGEHSNRYKAYDVANRQAKRKYGWGGYVVLSATIQRPFGIEGGTNPTIKKWRVRLVAIPRSADGVW